MTRARAAAVLGACAALAAGGCGERPAPAAAPAAAAWFEERLPASGIDFVHRSGADGRFLFPEVMAGGAALLDHDEDGDLDLYLVQAGDLLAPSKATPGNKLYRNDGGLVFRDATEAAGVGDRGYGMGAAVGDVDGDGHEDLFVTNVGADALYRSRGDGTFVECGAAAGVAGNAWSTSAAFLDGDEDGDLDLWVTRYVVWSASEERTCRTKTGERTYCSPRSYEAPAPDALFVNDGGGRFADGSEAAGLFAAYGNGLGVACGDFDRDGRVDVYVANDGNPNQLWINRGDGTFQDEAGPRSCAVDGSGVPEAGMGVQALDADGDGDLDLFLTHLRHETNTFYRCEGAWFQDATAQLGLAAPSFASTGFGLGFHDLDHDGRLDLYVANGRVVRWDPPPDPRDPYAEANQLFVGGERGFTEHPSPEGPGRARLHASRAAVFGDLDDDGDVDVVVVNRDAPPYLLANVAPKRGGWAVLRVLDRDGRDALFAELRIEAGALALARRVDRAYGYCGSSDARVHVGLGDAAQVDRVRVRWPDGGLESFGPLAANARHVLERGRGRPGE